MKVFVGLDPSIINSIQFNHLLLLQSKKIYIKGIFIELIVTQPSQA